VGEGEDREGRVARGARAGAHGRQKGWRAPRAVPTRFQLLLYGCEKGNLMLVEREWSDDMLETFLHMGAYETAHPLLRATHHVHPDVVEVRALPGAGREGGWGLGGWCWVRRGWIGGFGGRSVLLGLGWWLMGGGL
jgi:hypothetical protein